MEKGSSYRTHLYLVVQKAISIYGTKTIHERARYNPNTRKLVLRTAEDGCFITKLRKLLDVRCTHLSIKRICSSLSRSFRSVCPNIGVVIQLKNTFLAGMWSFRFLDIHFFEFRESSCPFCRVIRRVFKNPKMLA